MCHPIATAATCKPIGTERFRALIPKPCKPILIIACRPRNRNNDVLVLTSISVACKALAVTLSSERTGSSADPETLQMCYACVSILCSPNKAPNTFICLSHLNAHFARNLKGALPASRSLNTILGSPICNPLIWTGTWVRFRKLSSSRTHVRRAHVVIDKGRAAVHCVGRKGSMGHKYTEP